MGIIDSMLINLESDSKNANMVYGITINALVNEGYLTHEQATKILKSYAIIILKPSWFHKLLNKLLGEEGWKYQLVKMVNTLDDEDVKEPEKQILTENTDTKQ